MIPLRVAQVATVLAAARTHGELVAYSFAPPALSEVFLAAVGRSDEDDEPVADLASGQVATATSTP